MRSRGRKLFYMGCLLLASASGCTHADLAGLHWPWQKPPITEELVTPPENDLRYSSPQSYPKNVTTPQLKRDTFDIRKMPIGGFGGNPAGGMGP